VSGRRLFILEPALVDVRGHHAFAAVCFANLIKHFQTTIVAGRGWKRGTHLGEFPVAPVFRHNRQSVSRLRRYGRGVAQAMSIGGHVAEPLTAYLKRRPTNNLQTSQFSIAAADARNMRSVIGRELANFLDDASISGDDEVFIPSADAEFVLAVAEQLHSRTNLPRFHVRLMYDDIACHRTDPTWRSALHVLLGAPDAANRVCLLAETCAFAQAIEAIWSHSVAVLPHPSDLPATPAPDLAGAFEVYLAGQSRADKGTPLVHAVAQALTTELDATGLAVRFRIQGGAKASYGGVQIEPLSSHLSACDYALSWRRAHAALLLHDPRVYALRGSGVVSDAVASARPFIYIAGSSLVERNLCGNALETDPHPQLIARTIVKLIEAYPRTAAASANAAQMLADSVQIGLRGLLPKHAQ
jgi:hypothetical protein